MTITRVYNGITVTDSINVTTEFRNATALFMVAPDITDEYEVDFYLQIRVTEAENRLVKLNQDFTLDTVVIYPIPIELQNLDEPLYGVFTASSSIALEVYIIERVAVDVEEVLEEIREFRNEFRVETIREAVSDTLFALSDTQQSLAIGAVATSLSPLTLGGSLTALPFVTASTGLLSPVTLGTGTLIGI